MRFIALVVGAIALGLLSGYFLRDDAAFTENEETKARMEEYLDGLYKAERAVIEKVPIYEDIATGAKQQLLRKYLLGAHLAVVQRKSLEAIEDDAGIAEALKIKTLANAQPNDDDFFYYYNVPEKYRFLHPDALEGLRKIGSRLQQKLKERSPNAPGFKVAVSSALRPIEYQQQLRGVNVNASLESSHSYGLSFDIFYDDFVVDLPEIPGVEGERPLKDSARVKLRSRMKFLLGDALRRQFHAVLFETLIDMQNEGILYAIWERNQRCYHVTIL